MRITILKSDNETDDPTLIGRAHVAADKPEPKPWKMPTDQQIRDGMALAGFLILLGGIGAYDWRFAAVICGMILMTAAVFGSLKN